jgi:hypothetical protein
MTRTADPGQVALFDLAEVEQGGRAQRARAAKALAAAELEEARAEWVARFERADWVAPWDCAAGRSPGEPAPKKGDRLPGGWVCPACKDVEPNEFLLGNNHGYRLYDPGHVPYLAEFGATCFKLELEKNHRIYDARKAMIRHLIDAGLDDEQIAGRVGFWPASMIARDRKEYAKAARQAAKAARGEVVKVGHGSDCPCSFCGGTCTCPSCDPDPQGRFF